MTLHIHQLQDREWLAEQCAKRTSADIAAELGCDRRTIFYALDRYGLQPYKRPCQFCGESFGGGLAYHERHCIYNPTVWAATLALLDDGTGRIRMAKRYMEHAANTGAARSDYLVDVLGTWDNVAYTFGLKPFIPRKRIDSEHADIFTDEDIAYMRECERVAAYSGYREGLNVLKVIDSPRETVFVLR